MVSATGENLVFVVSTPRAGSTLLGAMLGSHSAIACPSEPWFLLRLSAIHSPAMSTGWYDDELAAKATRAFVDADTFRRGVRDLAATIYNTHLTQTGRRILIDKTPRYYHIIGFLADAFPAAKVIWLQRNPFAIAASFKTTWNVDVDVLTGRHLTPHTFDLGLALRVLAHHFDQRGPAHLEVHYETLVTSPAAELQRICNFLEIPFEERMLEYGENAPLIDAYRRSEFGDRSLLDHGAVHHDAIDRWRTVLTPEEIADLTHIIGPPLLHRLGYDAPAAATTQIRNTRAPDPVVAAVLARNRSPAEPSESQHGAATDQVLRTLNNRELAQELMVARGERDHWHTAYRDVENLLRRWPLRIAMAIIRWMDR